MLAPWRERLAVRVARRPDGAAMARAVRAAAPKSWREGGHYQYYSGRQQWPYLDPDLDRAAHLMALAGARDEEVLLALIRGEGVDPTP